MAILKKRSWLNRGRGASDVPVRRSTGRPVGNGTSFPASSSDSSDSEPLESINAHLFQVGDQVCELPHELFDSPDLTHILSLDTWNFVLNDEDREALFTLLPSMDEGTYRWTLKDLFAGESFNFTSPVADLFDLLRSGQCHPEAVCSREALVRLQRIDHQHDVRVYHNHMVNSFIEMQQIWQSYPNARIEERMEMWKAWKVKHERLTPRFFLERKEGPLQNQHFQNLMKRKVSYLRTKEDASQLMAASARLPDADSKVIGQSRVARGHVKKSVDNVFGNMLGRPKRPHPKGVLKLLPKAVVRNNMDIKMSQMPYPFNEVSIIPAPASPETESSFDDKIFSSPLAHESTVSPSMEWSSDSPIREEMAFKYKSENKIKPMDAYSRQENERGRASSNNQRKQIDGLESKSKAEKEDLVCTQATVLHEIQDMNLSSVAEQMQTCTSGISVHRGDDPKKKVKRKRKAKDLEPVKYVEGNVHEVNSIEAILAEKEVQDILDDKDEPAADEKPVKRSRKKLQEAVDSSLPQSSTLSGEASLSENFPPAKVSRKRSVSVPPLAMSFTFSVIHLLSAVRQALTTFSSDELMHFNSEHTFTDHPSNDEDNLILPPNAMYRQPNGLSLQGDDRVDVAKEQEEKKAVLPYVSLKDIVKKVQANPGDPRILVTQEPLQGLVRGVLKVLSSKTTQAGMKGWKPLVTYSRRARGWSWIGPLPPAPADVVRIIEQISHEAWSVPQKTLYKLQELFSDWLKHEQDILWQLGHLALAPPLTTPIFLDEKERFRELRAQKSLTTISPTSEAMRAYFRREEALRYSVPDRAFSYTCLDGNKSAVAPLRRIGGKPNSKARDHFMLKSDRPPHVTILCLVRDAAARLPGSIGTRADVCSLIRDSQYIVEDVSDAQLNQVVSGALDRLHYERDPCVRFDGDRKLWVYLHTDKEDEDFEDDATSSTKRWRRTKKEGIEGPELCLTQDHDYLGRDDQDSCGLGIDFSATSCFGGPSDLSSVYTSAGRNELMYTHPCTSPLVLESAFSGSGREDMLLPFIELPPSIQPPCVSMQQSHPMGWEVLGNRWEQDAHFQSPDHIVEEDYSVVASIASTHRESEVLIDSSS